MNSDGVDHHEARRPQEDPRGIVPHDALRLGVLVLTALIVPLAGRLRDQQLDLRIPVVAGSQASRRPLRPDELAHLLRGVEQRRGPVEQVHVGAATILGHVDGRYERRPVGTNQVGVDADVVQVAGHGLGKLGRHGLLH